MRFRDNIVARGNPVSGKMEWTLREFDPSTIIVMNPIYRDEIADMVRNMQLDAVIQTV